MSHVADSLFRFVVGALAELASSWMLPWPQCLALMLMTGIEAAVGEDFSTIDCIAFLVWHVRRLCRLAIVSLDRRDE